MKRNIRRTFAVLGILLAIVVAVFVITGGPLTDLKPPDIAGSAQPDRDSRGRALLESAWQAAGGERTLSHPAARFELRDHWQGISALFSPWPDDDQRATVTLETHTFNSRVAFHNGEADGTTWGIDGGRAWSQTSGARQPSDNGDLLFMLPTVHYFAELSQRLTEAPIARWVEQRTIAGRTYDVVYATWTAVDAHDGEDQYLVFIDRETGRIGKVQYTVREIARFISGTCHLEDQREVDGVWVSHRMSVTSEPTDSPDDYMHRMSLEDFTWLDAVEG